MGVFGDWGKLTPEEQAEWMEALTIADRRRDAVKNGGYVPMSLRESLLEYESENRIKQWN